MPFAKGVCNCYENSQIQLFTKKGGDLSKSNTVFSPNVSYFKFVVRDILEIFGVQKNFYSIL